MRRESGVRKARGARREDIIKQFVLEAVVRSELGGLAGILFGGAGGNGIAFWLDMSVVFPWGWALTGLIVCSVIGLGFGWYPAWKAASLEPIEALRFELARIAGPAEVHFYHRFTGPLACWDTRGACPPAETCEQGN